MPRTARKHRTTNADIAQALDRIALLLEVRKENMYRIRSYRNAARVLRTLQTPLARTHASGRLAEVLKEHGIGERLTGVIAEYLDRGNVGLLDELLESITPAEFLEYAASLEKGTARQLVASLHIADMNDLFHKIADGTVAEASDNLDPSQRASLAALHSIAGENPAEEELPGEEPSTPPVAMILDVDREYREQAEAGTLKTIAPKSRNPEGEAWLPIMRVRRKGWVFQALFSNTQRAHESGKTHDWVVVYFRKEGEEQQCTVVTEHRGALKGKRVIRGREKECLEYYKKKGQPEARTDS